MATLLPVLLIAALALLWNHGSYSEWFATEVTTTDIVCSDNHGYQIEILSKDPLMMRIPNFISPVESAYFAGIAEKNFTYRLHVKVEDVKKKVAPPMAVLNPHDPFVKCLQHRAQRFLGSMSSPDFELLSLIRYNVSHSVQQHTDAAPEPLTDSKSNRRFNRNTSFFVYVHASDDLEGGETFFPRIPPPPANLTLSASPGFRSISNVSGAFALAVKPVSRSAIFWVGVKPDGSVDPNTIHEGLPVTRGEKIGMNIWARHYID